MFRNYPEACGGLDIMDFMSALQKEALPVLRSFAATIMQQPATQGIAAAPVRRLHCGLASVGQHGKIPIVWLSLNPKAPCAGIADSSPLAGDGGSSHTLLP